MSGTPPNTKNFYHRGNRRQQPNQNPATPPTSYWSAAPGPARAPSADRDRDTSPFAAAPVPILRSNRPSAPPIQHAPIVSRPNPGHYIQPFLQFAARQPAPVQPAIPLVFRPIVPAQPVQAPRGAPRNTAPSATGGNPQATARPLTQLEKQVNDRIVEIILTLNKSNEFVSRERVQEELFRSFNVQAWTQLKTYPSNFVPLINLTDRQKGVTFYVQILEQTFNLCTLHDLEPLLVKFLKVERYEDLHLGPLSKHPKIQEIFDYHPTDEDQPVPAITTGDIIKTFMDFQRTYRGARTELFEKFLDHLVRKYQLQNRADLGFFCKSFPFLIQVTANVRRDHDTHLQQIVGDARQELIEDVRAQLDELKEKMRDVSHLSALNEKKTPMAVFNYLTSIVEKHFTIVPEQSIVYAALALLRDNELLRYLLNVSIYLGEMEQPEALVAEFKKFYEEKHPSEDLSEFEQRLIFEGELSTKDRRKMKALTDRRKSKEPRSQASGAQVDGDDADSSAHSHTRSDVFKRRKQQPAISLRELCSEINHMFMRHNSALSLQQLLDVEKYFCDQHGVNDFSEFNYGEDASDDTPGNLISFLARYRDKIDPEHELSIYDQQSSGGLREEFRPFVQQLSILHHDAMSNEQHATTGHGDLNIGQKRVSKETWAVVDKVLKHKFGESVGFSQGKQLIKKAMQSKHLNQYSTIHFEESLLDVNSLNRLDVCPSSLNVDLAQLCDLVLRAPLMTDLYAWLQWSTFFQPKYGSLSSFIANNEMAFQQLILLETSTHELIRLPSDASLSKFEQELQSMRVRSAVGHLCALIVQEGIVTRFSFNVYRTSMETWFRQLRSLATLHNDRFNAMGYILDFLTFFPSLIGQSRVIEELVVGPLDQVFGDEPGMTSNARARLWNVANAKQKSKLELWGYTLNVDEWKNEEKWSGTMDFDETSEMVAKAATVSSKPQQKVDPLPRSPDTVDSFNDSQPVNSPTTSPDVKPPSYSGDDADSNLAAREHIESIRRGLGVSNDLDAASQSIVSNLQGVIKRSLEKISTDLYSEEGHFVLELIQNADDNQYEEVTPTLRFILSSNRILVCNNELGFQPGNISAICNVGASTKGKHKQGYAGHKGIGFKSVFMVSDQPEIHSGNYHICFDTGNAKDLMGYIRPIWVNQSEEDLPDSKEWPTCIRLPVKKDARGDRLQQKFDNIQARLLLFLNRLRKIEIIQEPDSSASSASSRTFSRIDHADGQIIELQEKSSNGTVITDLWLVVKEVIEVPENIKEKLRDVKGNVDFTTIAIAYPLNGIEKALAPLPPSQPLFAYLPLCSYGFRFILQADFEIPANRQDIRRDNLWNEWLKLEMPQLLYRAYLQFQRLPELLASLNIDGDRYHHLTPIQTMKYFLRLIPSRHELNPYFHSFIDKSIQLLTGIMKLPVSRSTNESNAQVDWVLPSQCILVQDPLIRKVLSQDLLLSHFNSYYVHEELVNECDDKVLMKLGCRPLDFSDITRLMEVSYKPDERERVKTKSTIEEIAQWLVCLDFGLQQQREQMLSDTQQKKRSEETIARLKQMKIIPLRLHPHFVSIDQFEKNTILFPFEKSTKYTKDLGLVLDDVPIIDEDLLNFIEDKHSRRLDSIKKLLRDLGVRDTPRIRDIFRQHILPVMSDSARWSSKSEDLLIAYLICIYRYIYSAEDSLSENDMKQLRKSLVIKTRDKKFVSLSTPGTVVHLTSIYGCRMSLEELALTKYRFNFIADDYLYQYSADLFRTPPEKSKFRGFLQEIGLCESLQVNPNDRTFSEVSQLAGTPWAHRIDALSDLINEPFIIKDNICDEFDQLVLPSEEHPKGTRELCIQLFQYLHNYHRAFARSYAASVVSACRHKFGQGEEVMGVESSFCLSLRQNAWIPVERGELMKPADVYYLFGDTETFRPYVPHLDVAKLAVNDPEFLFNILGLQKQVAPKTMFEFLMKWSCGLDSESLWKLIESAKAENIPCSLPVTFRQLHSESLENLRQIYTFLFINPETRALLSRFRLWPLVFIPRDDRTGHFCFVEKLYWQDPIFQMTTQDIATESNSRIAIGPYYDDTSRLTSLFLTVLKVEMQPTVDDYLLLLAAAEDIEKSWKVIEIIAKLAIEQQKELEVQAKCQGIAFIPCISHQKKLVKYTDQPIYPSDMEMAELFADALPIIKLPSVALSPDSKANFCSLFNIKDLSEVIRTEVKVENERPSVILSDFYRRSIDLIQAFLLNAKLLSEARSKDLAAVFARMHFVCVDLIRVSYCSEANVKKSSDAGSSNETYVDEKAGKFYILTKFENSDMRYIDAMVAFLLQDETARAKLSAFMKTLLKMYQKDPEEGLKKLREKQTIQYEPKWIIPEDVKEDVLTVPMKAQKEGKKLAENVVITEEEKAALLSEFSLRPPPTQKEATADEKVVSSMTSYPARGPTVESTTQAANKSTGQGTATRRGEQSTDGERPRQSNTGNHEQHDDHEQRHPQQRADGDHEQRHHEQGGDHQQREHEHSTPRTEGTESTTHRDATREDATEPKDPLYQTTAPKVFSDDTSLPAVSFNNIAVSKLTDLDLSMFPPTPSVAVRAMTTEADLVTGRQGEELVFRILKHTYPTDEVNWMNENGESGKPFDIHLKLANQDEEFIEVKTTRAVDQHTFPISIGEVQFFLKHATNYFIYRVYLADRIERSTIAKVHKIEENLKQKHLKLSMTVMSKPSE